MNKNKNKKKLKINRKWSYSISIGLSAGFIWGIYFLSVYLLKFSKIGPSFLSKPLINPEYITKWQGQLVGIVIFILFTIISALVYTLLFSRFKGPAFGVLYGAILWVFIFYILNPLFNLTLSVKELGLYTNSVMISLFILTGFFIGYSISIELNSIDKS